MCQMTGKPPVKSNLLSLHPRRQEWSRLATNERTNDAATFSFPLSAFCILICTNTIHWRGKFDCGSQVEDDCCQKIIKGSNGGVRVRDLLWFFTLILSQSRQSGTAKRKVSTTHNTENPISGYYGFNTHMRPSDSRLLFPGMMSLDM